MVRANTKAKKKHLITCGSLGVTNPTTQQALSSLTSVSETGTGFFLMIGTRHFGIMRVQLQSLIPLYRNKSQFRPHFCTGHAAQSACRHICRLVTSISGTIGQITAHKKSTFDRSAVQELSEPRAGAVSNSTIAQQLQKKDGTVQNAVCYNEFVTDDLPPPSQHVIVRADDAHP
jgi:hypothetical protein